LKNKKTPGQVVVIITIFIAVIIFLSIVLINIGKISDIKTSTSQIADGGALNLASQWSMYCNTIRDTMMRKAALVRIWGLNINVCISCTETRCECLNWGLLIPLAAIFLSIALMPFVPIISAALVLVFFNPLFNEVNAIMKGGFQSAAAQMTQYASMRESSILAMLSQAQFDDELADRMGSSDMFRFRYDCVMEPGHTTCTPVYYWYDLKDTPVAASIKSKQRIPRFSAWYWSKRYHWVTEAALIPEVKAFIAALVDITEFNTWDQAKWEYTEVSLKVPANNITCASGDCPEWAVPEKRIVRILSHISTDEKTIIDKLWDWLNGALGGINQSGFLPVKFTSLTKRLLDTPIYEHQIHYASRTQIDLPFRLGIWSLTYDTSEIMVVSEALRGMMLRAVELLNTPVSHRIPSLNSWLPAWYNKEDHSQDIYTRLGILLDGGAVEGKELQGIRSWITDLNAIDQHVSAIVPEPNGDCVNGTGDPAEDCSSVDCCEWDDSGHCTCACRCCHPYNDCTWFGTYCSCSPELHTELGFCPSGHGDIYSESSACRSLPNRHPSCPCGDCTGPHDPSWESVQACRFQGQLNWANNGGPTEIAQAIEILESLVTALETLRDKIKTFADRADAIMYPTNETIIQLQKEAIYGWQDKHGNSNIVRVNLDNYPARRLLPYIKESYGWFGFTKIWTLEGQTKGLVGDITVQRYTSDISVGSWWDLRYRMNPGGTPWPLDNLGRNGVGIIHDIQGTGIPSDAAPGLNTYGGITSETKGYYGIAKEDIYIERVR
jgi:hypothetical protein